MELADRFYKSTEVADILGVSLRTLYRYMDSGKIESVHLPSGRHRFTKQQIESFLYSNSIDGGKTTTPSQSNNVDVKPISTSPVTSNNPQQPINSPQTTQNDQNDDNLQNELDELLKSLDDDTPQNTTQNVPAQSVSSEPEQNTLQQAQNQQSEGAQNNVVEQNEEDDEESIDAELDELLRSLEEDDDSTDNTQSTNAPNQQASSIGGSTIADEPNIEPATPSLDENKISYYYCPYSDLKTIAKIIKKVGDDESVKYAFTLNAGLSLYFPLDPFSVIHFYVNSSDLSLWEDKLQLKPASQSEANIGLLQTTGGAFVDTNSVSGLTVVGKTVLLKNLRAQGLEQLAKEAEDKI